jgi:hypothetical protein
VYDIRERLERNELPVSGKETFGRGRAVRGGTAGIRDPDH